MGPNLRPLRPPPDAAGRPWHLVAAHLLFAFACSDFALERFSSAQTIVVLFLSRLVQGAGGATTGVVQAYVGDAVVPEERAKALGWITAATSAGVMIGPAIGSLASTVGASVPGLVAATLCALDLAFAWRWLPESTSREDRMIQNANISKQHGFMQNIKALIALKNSPLSLGRSD